MNDSRSVDASTWRKQFAKDSALVPVKPFIKEYIIAKTKGGASLIKVVYMEHLGKWRVVSTGRFVMDKEIGVFTAFLQDDCAYDTAEEAIEAFYGFYGHPKEEL